MAGFRNSAKYVFKRIDNSIENYVPHSDIDSVLYKIRKSGTQYSVDRKTPIQKNKKGIKVSMIGTVAGIAEAAATSHLLIKANELSLNVRQVGDKLYRISPWRELDWFERAVYPLANIKIGELPLTTILWAAAAVGTGLVTYYVAHKKLKD